MLKGMANKFFKYMAISSLFSFRYKLAVIAVSLFLVLSESFPIYAQQQGELILFNDFNAKKRDLRRAGFRGKYSVQELGGSKVIHVKSNGTDKRWVVLPLPLDGLRGRNIRVTARVKAENVTVPLHYYNGIKIMLQMRLPWEDKYPQATLPTGTFDWQTVSFTAFIPSEVEACSLTLGLEESEGKVWFDNIEVKAEGPALHLAPVPAAPPYKGHTLPRLRGMMVNAYATPDDLKTLSSWGANLVRWQLTWDGFPRSSADTASFESYMKWLNGVLDHVDRMMPLTRQLGLKVVLDLHTLPGGGTGKETADQRLFKDAKWQEAFQKIWIRIAEQFKNEPAIWGYDLANEPVEGTVPAGVMTWHELATATATAIRRIDTTHAIIVEGITGAEPIGLAMIKPIPVSGVVYSIHLYNPFEFTHQAIWASGPGTIAYPGVVAGREWDKQMLRRCIQMIIDWQHQYNTHIYVGEFSAIRWAPGESAYNYLKDCIELFEELGWDWTYHAFREFDGWSVEHTTDRSNPNKPETPTKRQQLMMEWLGKSQKAVYNN
jgi:endoglucanase